MSEIQLIGVSIHEITVAKTGAQDAARRKIAGMELIAYPKTNVIVS